MTNEEMRENELFLRQISRVSKSWLWFDTGEFYDFKDSKIIPRTEEGYKRICGIVSKQFSRDYIIKQSEN